jgi:pimeloyl-ACP methyl ester carboxylesterase
MGIGRHLLPLALLAAATPAAARAAGARAPGIALEPCQLASAVSSARLAARCGTLEVPEDRGRPGGRRLRLRVAVVPADTARAPDPVVVLAGGPGQAATEAFPAAAPAFARILRDRDVVLVDQRGTGGSGRLSCPGVPEPARGRAVDPERERREVEACAAALSRSADLSQYGTDAFVQDLDAVRAALGYAKVNLVGFSYGTRAALVYLRTFPDRVRTMVLDGVAPLELVVGGSVEADAQRALDVLFQRCRDDAACAARFPALEADLRALLARLEARPARVRVRDALTAVTEERVFGADHLRRVLVAFSYAAESVALLPPLLHAAAREGDLAPLAGALRIVSNDFEESIDRPLEFSVLCAEDVPFIVDGPPAADRTRYLGRTVKEQFRRVCGAWPVRPVPASWRTPVRSDVPALLLSGEADPVTPPRHAELAAKDLPRARHVVLAGQGHGVFTRGCVPRLAAEFVAAGSADGLDASCAERGGPAPLFLDAQGAAP